MQFADIANPTPDELRRWASIPDVSYPAEMSQDWDIIVANWSRIDVIVELAMNAERSNREFFLGVMYLMAGNCFWGDCGHDDLPRLRALLKRLQTSGLPPVRAYCLRVIELIADPPCFDYELWCGNGFVQRDRGSEQDISLS